MNAASSTPGRAPHEPPAVLRRKGWKYHHMGIPTEIPHEGEVYLKDLKDSAIRGETLIGEVSSPSKGVTVAMILDDGAPVELIHFDR